MKDIKTFVIGFLTCACLFLIMGQTDNVERMEWNVDGQVIVEPNENGRYQGFGSEGFSYLLDTTTGELFFRKAKSKKKGGNYWKQMVKPDRVGK